MTTALIVIGCWVGLSIVVSLLIGLALHRLSDE